MVRIISDISTLSTNSGLNVVRIPSQLYQETHGSYMVRSSQIFNLIKKLMAHNGKNYLRSLTVSRNSLLINGKNHLRYSTVSRNSWPILVRIISDNDSIVVTSGILLPASLTPMIKPCPGFSSIPWHQRLISRRSMGTKDPRNNLSPVTFRRSLWHQQ